MLNTTEGYFSYTECFTADSSVIRRLWRDDEENSVGVAFKNGDFWVYKDVSPEVWKEWKNASSTGAFYARHIKGVYESEWGGRSEDLWARPVGVPVETTAPNTESVIYVFEATVTRNVTEEVEVSLTPNSINDAIAAFTDANPGCKIISITTK